MSIQRFKKTPEYHLIILSFFLNLPWELLQLPLFSFKGDDNHGTILYAIVHCTIGDVLITLGVFEVVSLLNKSRFWFSRWKVRYLFLYVLLGVTYTILSEIKNMYYGNWMYNDFMPLIPIVEVGLVPVLAWLWIPLFSLYIMKRRFVTLVRQKKVIKEVEVR
ncbi:MAG: hypothetical protein HZC16_01540 [Candidatus Omnitrophica bacterium]|nr:hypothetical protein [Candidatus Omnitrophota bacterium]